jgi:hypothetical protein
LTSSALEHGLTTDFDVSFGTGVLKIKKKQSHIAPVTVKKAQQWLSVIGLSRPRWMESKFPEDNPDLVGDTSAVGALRALSISRIGIN